jgi:hypothetical protein
MDYRGQSALEYLMTYGWALVVILVVIAALFALGILSPATYQGATCRGFGKIAYFDHVYDSNGDFLIQLGNGSGRTITTGSATFGIDYDQDGTWDGSVATAATWQGSSNYLFQLASGSGAVTAGDNYISDVNIVYTPSGRLQQVETATCSGAYR